jgi:hypothetical protein
MKPPNPPLQQPNATRGRLAVGNAEKPRAGARGFSRP